MESGDELKNWLFTLPSSHVGMVRSHIGMVRDEKLRKRRTLLILSFSLVDPREDEEGDYKTGDPSFFTKIHLPPFNRRMTCSRRVNQSCCSRFQSGKPRRQLFPFTFVPIAHIFFPILHHLFARQLTRHLGPSQGNDQYGANPGS